MEITIFNWKIRYIWPFSIAMLIYQRVLFISTSCHLPQAMPGNSLTDASHRRVIDALEVLQRTARVLPHLQYAGPLFDGAFTRKTCDLMGSIADVF